MKFDTPHKVYAVIYGVLVQNFGKVQTAKFNKIASKLGYDKVNVQGLKELEQVLNDDEELSEIIDQAIECKISLKDVPKYQTDIKPFETDTLHNTITPYVVQQQQVLKNNREFTKMQREGAYTKMLFDELKEELRDVIGTESLFNSYQIPTFTPSNKTLHVQTSDFHIGASINDHYSHGGYNFEILKKRLRYYMDEVTKVALENHVEEIVFTFGGDMIEGANMRGGQMWKLEFSLAEQISHGYKVLYDMINELEKIAPVRVAVIRGNHDRLTGQSNKQDTIYNDSAMYVILDMLKTMQDSGLLQNTEFIESTSRKPTTLGVG